MASNVKVDEGGADHEGGVYDSALGNAAAAESIAVVGAGDASAGGGARGTAHGSGGGPILPAVLILIYASNEAYRHGSHPGSTPGLTLQPPRSQFTVRHKMNADTAPN